MRTLACLTLLISFGCARAESAGKDTPAPPADKNVTRADPDRLEKAEVTPELAEHAERLLEAHADAAVGTEIPFTLNGRRYVGRIEVHDNPEGEPDRPQGEHKGLTVYVAP